MQGTHTALHGVCTTSQSSTQFKTKPRLNNAEQKRSPATPALLSQTESESCRCILGHAGPPGRLVQVQLATRGSEESSSFVGSRSGRFSPLTALLAREVIANTELAERAPGPGGHTGWCSSERPLTTSSSAGRYLPVFYGVSFKRRNWVDIGVFSPWTHGRRHEDVCTHKARVTQIFSTGHSVAS